MTTIAENSKRDIYAGPDHNLVMAAGIDQCGQLCKSAMETLIGECVLDLGHGLPYDAAIWTRYLPRQFETAARRRLVQVLDVASVVSFNITRAGDVANYRAVILTTFGKNVAVQGVIPNVG